MSKKQWLVLLMLFLTYLLLGASIFYHIESRLEIENVKKARQERIEINALLHEHYTPSYTHDQDEILEKLTSYCGKSVYNYTEGETDRLKWDFYNSFYFAYTVVSTIGYGNLAPTNMLSRILMIFYGLIGIPMNGILLTQLGEFFGNVFVKAHRQYKAYKNHGQNDYYPRKLTSLEGRKVGLAAQIFAYLTPGFVMFIFFPAFLFSHYEGWTYDEAVYYAFVTLTTIGFGDIVAGQDNSKGSGFFFILYKTFLICWISFGLGYIVMIMTFIARGMRSKKITRIEHKLAMNLKHTQSKIWNEFNKEISYLRRVFNELQLSKVKRVYVDECEYESPPSKLLRCNSFPDIRNLMYGANMADKRLMECQKPRRRANSEVAPMEDQVARVVSETDLQRIDKTATFAAHAMVQPAELLARLVNILGYIPPDPDDLSNWERESDRGMTTEQEANRNEGHRRDSRLKEIIDQRKMSADSTWMIGNQRILPYSGTIFRKPRSRATSEVRLHESKIEETNNQRNVEWTWSGPAASGKIRELMNARTADDASTVNDPSYLLNTTNTGKLSKLRPFALAKAIPKALLPPRWKRQFSNTKNSSAMDIGSANVQDKEAGFGNNERQSRSSTTRIGLPFITGRHSVTRPDDRRDSATRRIYNTHTGAASPSSFTEGTSLLEETSLADFLRAITVLHASVGTVPDEYARKPRRKMGTASLTPPKLPSLFTLFSPLSSTADPAQSGNADINAPNASSQSTITRGMQFPFQDSEARRLSLSNTGNKTSGSSTPSSRPRKGSLAFLPKPRRFSLRPVPTPTGPPTPPPENGGISLSNVQRDTSEGPKEPLIEGGIRASGISMPIRPPVAPRRYSLRPDQSIKLPPGNAAASSTSKPIPRWRAGMLQRQIGQMNLRRRARAFSLSDVQTNESEDIGSQSRIATHDDAETLNIGVDKPGDSVSNEFANIPHKAIVPHASVERESTQEAANHRSTPLLPSLRSDDSSASRIISSAQPSHSTTQIPSDAQASGKLQSGASKISTVDVPVDSRSLFEVKVEEPASAHLQRDKLVPEDNSQELKIDIPEK